MNDKDYSNRLVLNNYDYSNKLKLDTVDFYLQKGIYNILKISFISQSSLFV